MNITKAQLDAINKGLLDKFGIPDSPMPNSLLADLVIGVAQRLIDAIREDMERKELKSTGNLIAETGVGDFIETPSGVTVPIMMSKYYLYVDQGRRPGNKPPIQSLENWIRNKRTVYAKVKPKEGQTMDEAVRSFAIAISRKIASKGTIKRFGYKGANFIDDVLTPANIYAIAQHLGDALGKPITAYVTSEIATT